MRRANTYNLELEKFTHEFYKQRMKTVNNQQSKLNRIKMQSEGLYKESLPGFDSDVSLNA